VLGGSTNAVLHLLAMARAVNIPFSLADIQEASDRVPFLGKSIYLFIYSYAVSG
jgi:dihydroxyacid dehydratase/phosphogluconate dehydratase